MFNDGTVQDGHFGGGGGGDDPDHILAGGVGDGLPHLFHQVFGLYFFLPICKKAGL